MNMSTTKERLVLYLEQKKATKVRRIADRKKWSITDLLEEALDCFIVENSEDSDK